MVSRRAGQIGGIFSYRIGNWKRGSPHRTAGWATGPSARNPPAQPWRGHSEKNATSDGGACQPEFRESQGSLDKVRPFVFLPRTPHRGCVNRDDRQLVKVCGKGLIGLVLPTLVLCRGGSVAGRWRRLLGITTATVLIAAPLYAVLGSAFSLRFLHFDHLRRFFVAQNELGENHPFYLGAGAPDQLALLHNPPACGRCIPRSDPGSRGAGLPGVPRRSAG